jgi:Uma2 family endonuclease
MTQTLEKKLEKIINVEAYLELEKSSEIRHEYIDGELLAMAGEKLQHNDIVANIIEALRPIARAKKCRLQFETVKLQVKSTRYRYPDVMVSCAPGDNPYFLENPCFIIEVLSESTQATDTGPKLDEYTRLPSLERYVMVEQDRRVVRIYRRTPEGWLFESLEDEGEIEVPCLETKLTLEQVFAGIEFEAREVEIASEHAS